MLQTNIVLVSTSVSEWTTSWDLGCECGYWANRACSTSQQSWWAQPPPVGGEESASWGLAQPYSQADAPAVQSKFSFEKKR